MNCCNAPMSDFSYYRPGEQNRVLHFHCVKCGHRHHDGKDYTRDEWFFYINEETFQEYRERIDADFNSIHAHELINHSNK